jgi:co-chaperonin GroES (HSP10)
MAKLQFAPNVINKMRPLNDNVIVVDMAFEYRVMNSGIIVPNDNGKSSGIRPRWAKVYAVGPDQIDVKVGQWVCVAHGRWTRGVLIHDSEGEKTIRRVDPDDIMLISDEPVFDETMGDKVV